MAQMFKVPTPALVKEDNDNEKLTWTSIDRETLPKELREILDQIHNANLLKQKFAELFNSMYCEDVPKGLNRVFSFKRADRISFANVEPRTTKIAFVGRRAK